MTPAAVARVIHIEGRSLTLSCLLLFSAVAASACAVFTPPAEQAGEGKTRASSSLTPAERVEIFEEVWRTINDEYYDPTFNGVDWQDVRTRYRPRFEAAASDWEFYGLFEIMLSELRDGHTSLIPPPLPELPQVQGDQPHTIGLRLGEAEGHVVVVEVEPDTAAARAGIKPGMILRTVNGRPVEEHFSLIRSVLLGGSSERDMKNKMLSALLYAGFLSVPRTLGLSDFDGEPFEVVLPLEKSEAAATTPGLSARRLASGYGYIRFTKWFPPVERQFKAELARLSDAPGLVIDLRGNPGGETKTLLDIASNFFPEETYYGGFRARSGELKKYFTHASDLQYRGAVVILVDERSASASETFSIFMQESGRAAAVVGRQTPGSTLNRTGQKKVKGGGTLLYSARAYISPRGRNPEGTGVIPEEIVPLTIADLRANRDAVLEAAERRLRALGASDRGPTRGRTKS